MRIPWFALLLLILPVAEIAGFIVVGSEIGVLATLLLIFATSLLGLLLLRIQGIGVLARIRRESDAGRIPGREMIHAAMILIAGVLLLVPGFLTDLAGLLLFIPAIREIGWRLVRDRIVLVGESGHAARRQAPVIDLDESEYDSQPRPDSPWRRE